MGVGRLLGGVLNFAGGLLGGHQHAHTQWQGHSHGLWPGHSGQAPGHAAGTPPPGQGGTPPGQSHAPAQVTKSLNDNFAPQHAPAPVDLKPGASGEKAAPAGPPDVTGRKGPAGNDPKISQFNPAGADANYTNAAENCGPTVAAMVARNTGYGKGMTDAQLIEDLGKVGGTTAAGTSGNGMVAMYEHMGLDTNATQGANLTWIQQELQAGHHVTVLGDYYEVPGRIDPTQTSGHYLDVTGMTKEGDFLVNDPADTKLTSMTAAQMTDFITNSPTGGFAISAWKPTGAAAATPVAG